MPKAAKMEQRGETYLEGVKPYLSLPTLRVSPLFCRTHHRWKRHYFVHDSIVLLWSGLGERIFHYWQVVHPFMVIFGTIFPASNQFQIEMASFPSSSPLRAQKPTKSRCWFCWLSEYSSLIIWYLTLLPFYLCLRLQMLLKHYIYLEDRALCFYIQGGGSGGLWWRSLNGA